MYGKSMATCRILRQLEVVCVLRASEVDRSPPRLGPPESDVTNEVPAIALPTRAWTASPRMARKLSDNDTLFFASQRDIFRWQSGSVG